MRINAVTQPITSEIRKIEARKAEKETKTSRVASDKSDISQNAQRLSDTKADIGNVSALVSAQPDVRADKIAEVKQKIENGYYNSEEFIDKLADKLMAEFGMKNK